MRWWNSKHDKLYRIMNYNIEPFFTQQLANWQTARINYESLKNIRSRRFQLASCHYEIQFNPERIRSVVTPVEKEEKTKANCFLCEQNRPAEQLKLPFNDRFDILCNPYPVFSRHLTIASKMHTPQTITNELDTLLQIAKALPDFIVFYNGPHCGASAPEHLHFQAGIKDEFPLFQDYKDLKNNNSAQEKIFSQTVRYIIWDGVRKFYALESPSMPELSGYFYQREEENVNLLAWYEEGKWILCVFERKKHRPDRFFVTGEHQLLISPAAVEAAGKIITVREEDFNKITPQDIIEIFEEVLK